MGGFTVGGVLLAAGEGRRFGAPKALIEVAGATMVERGVRLLFDGGCDEVVVVLGAAAAEVRRRVCLLPARPLHNPRWATGRASSLRVGLGGLSPASGAAVIALVDQPLVGPDAVRRLAAAWRAGARAAVATYSGARRNPVLLGRALWGPVTEQISGDTGARVLLASRPGLAVDVACDGTGSPEDVDTPSDLERILRLVPR